MKLYLVRHTRVDVPSGICYGQTDVPLAESFEAESASVRSKLSGIAFEAVFCSPLSRCVKLGTLLNYPLQLDDRLKELNFGEWENQPWDTVFESETGKKWFADYLNEACPAGESYRDMLCRIRGFIGDLPDTGGNILVITHAGVIRAFRILLEGHPEDMSFVERILPASTGDTSRHSLHEVFEEPIAYGQITIIEKRS